MVAGVARAPHGRAAGWKVFPLPASMVRDSPELHNFRARRRVGRLIGTLSANIRRPFAARPVWRGNMQRRRWRQSQELAFTDICRIPRRLAWPTALQT
ncbi:hypothetical protein CBM2589_B190043 [Cupriavidus taiwanensis]|uniref:Uncharacterized protein n=1 Tax=Cupriavidus taiwanensis TaxID=164546 RepID=A0A375BLC7_9BURK|nr:hypothetical protein CBM2589_B190043 [Cupriavidus taiwanensis]